MRFTFVFQLSFWPTHGLNSSDHWISERVNIKAGQWFSISLKLKFISNSWKLDNWHNEGIFREFICCGCKQVSLILLHARQIATPQQVQNISDSEDLASTGPKENAYFPPSLGSTSTPAEGASLLPVFECPFAFLNLRLLEPWFDQWRRKYETSKKYTLQSSSVPLTW